MTIHFHTGFEGSTYADQYFTTLDSSPPVSQGVVATDPHSGTNCFEVAFASNDNWLAWRANPTEAYSWAGSGMLTFGFAVKASSLATLDIFAFGFGVKHATTNGYLYVAVEEDGSMTVRRNTALSMALGTALGSAVAGTFPDDGGWHYVELHGSIHDSTGVAEVWLDGVKVIDVAATDTQQGIGVVSGFSPGINLSSATGSPVVSVDDVYVASGLSAVLGPQVHEALVPTSSVESGGLGSDGNSVDNFLLVDSVSTDYVDITSGERDRYGLADRTETGDVNAVTVRAVLERPDLGLIVANGFALSGATETDGPGLVLGGGKRVVAVTGVLETDPNTAAAWTTSGVNALTVGVEAS